MFFGTTLLPNPDPPAEYNDKHIPKNAKVLYCTDPSANLSADCGFNKT